MSYETDLEKVEEVQSELEELIYFLINMRSDTDNELVEAAINQLLDGADIGLEVQCDEQEKECTVTGYEIYGLLDISETVSDLVKDLNMEISYQNSPGGETCGEKKED